MDNLQPATRYSSAGALSEEGANEILWVTYRWMSVGLAITGLVAALFVMSFNPYADDDQQRRMRKTALRFGVPALLSVSGLFSPGWHQPMRSETAENAPVSALAATRRSPMSFAAA